MTTITEIKELKRQIEYGKCIQRNFNSVSAITITMNSDILIPTHAVIEKWIQNAITLVYSFLPKTIINSEFPEICLLRDSLSKQILITTAPNIDLVINVLNACLRFLEWLLLFDEEKLNPAQKADFWFSPIDAAVSYLEKDVIPKITVFGKGRTKETVLLHLFGRLFILFRTIKKLNDSRCYQSLISSLRNKLELYLDFKLVQMDKIENGIEKFFSFYEVYRFRSAQNLKRIDNELFSQNSPKKVLSLMNMKTKNHK